MKFKSFLAASVVALSAAASAQAADIVVHNTVPVVVVPAFSWTGFYIGAQAAYGWGKDKNEYYGVDGSTIADYTTGFVRDHDMSPKGWMGGLYAGFNSDFYSDAVLGIETDFSWGESEESFRTYTSDVTVATPTPSTVNVLTSGTTKSNWNGATRLRIGYSADRVMPYLAGGVAYTNITADAAISTTTATDIASVTDANTTRVAHASSEDHTLVGWTVGAGIDYAAVDNVILRLEYRYNDFGKKDFSSSTFNRENMGFKKKFSSNDIRVGIAYKF